MSARLVPLNPGHTSAIPLLRPVVLVGRHPECDFRIDHPKISRRHCCLALIYERVVIKDLGSRNGLRVNGRIIDEAQLFDGDEVALGPIIFRLEGAAPAPAPPPAQAVPVSALAPPPPPPPITVDASGPPSLPFLPIDPDNDLLPIDL